MTKTHGAAHHKIQAIKRSAGRSAVAAAAYRHNARMTDERTGLVHDFTRKGDLVAEGVIGWTDTPERLWNAAEAAENRKNSITAREIVLALPHELDQAAQEKLIKGHCLMMRDRYKVACSWVIHDPENGGNKNTHAHIMITSREVSKAGEFGKKTRILDDRTTGSKEFEHMREAWAKRANAALEKAGVAERIDHRSHARRAEAGEAPPQERQRHMGPRLTAIARKHEAATEAAKAQGKPEPIAPRFVKEQKRIKVRNAALWGLFNAHAQAKTAANTDGKIRDEGDGTEAQAIADTAALFENAMASPLMVFRLADRQRREKERQKEREARKRPARPPQGGGVVQMKHTAQERPQPAPAATPQARTTAQAQDPNSNVIALFEAAWERQQKDPEPARRAEARAKEIEKQIRAAQPQNRPKQMGLVEALRAGLAEEPTPPRPVSVSQPSKAEPTPKPPSLFTKVLSFFTAPKPEPERQTEKPAEGPKPWQRVETPTKPPERPEAQTPTPEPQSKATDSERAAVIEKAALSMLPPEGQKPRRRRERLHEPPPPALKTKKERTRGPPQR